MKLKTLAILIVLLGGMGSYIYFGIQKPAEKKAADGDGDKIALGDTSKLQSLELEIKGSKVRLEKDEKNWRLTQPIKDLASESKITNFVNALQKLKKTKVIVEASKVREGKDISQYGVKDPRAKVTYKTSDLPDPFVITIGGQNPSFSGSYIQVGTDPSILLATMDLDYLGTQKADDFREMRLTTVNPDRYAKIELKAKGKTMVFKKEKDGWVMVSPYDLPIDPEFMRNFLEKISLIRANAFLEKSPTSKTADIEVIVGFEEGQSDARTSANDARPNGVQIDVFKVENPSKPKPKAVAKTPPDPIGEEKFSYYAKSDKTDFAAVSKFHFDNLDKTPEDFIKKSFDDFLISDVQSLKVQGAGKPSLEIIRKSETAFDVLQGKESKMANTQNVEDALRQLRNLHALKFLEKKASTTGLKPTLSIDLALKGGDKRSFIFELKKDIGELYIRRGADWLRYVVSAEPLKTQSFEFDTLTKAESAPAISEKKPEEKSAKKE